MPLDPTKVALAVESGLSAICALCEHFWNANDKGADDCGQQCGGPISGGTFDRYTGPVTDFSKICFRCGGPATHAVRAANSVRVLGCCREHVELVQQWKPVDRPAVNVVVLSPNGEKFSDELPVLPTKVRLKII